MNLYPLRYFFVLNLIQLVIVASTLGHDGQATAMEERHELLQRGEAALARGDVSQALQAFERASTMMHAADSEMGLVRAYMQGGAYRRALSFAAHAAGAHRETPAGAVLYAWLLQIGGQTAFAQRMLDNVAAKHPHDALVVQMQTQLQAPAPVATSVLLSGPWRTAPFDTGAELPVTAHVVCSGVLIDGGRYALAPLGSVSEARRLWVRDGLGRRKAAQVERRVESLGLVLLRLDDPINRPSDLVLAPRDPFPGSPGFAFNYTTTADAAPAWPLLHAGFIGKPDANSGFSKLGIEILAGAEGGPVVDNSGRFIGIALRNIDGHDHLLAVSTLRREFGELFDSPAQQVTSQRMPFDAIYEIAMPVTLQIIVE
jgi:hypothetical protein